MAAMTRVDVERTGAHHQNVFVLQSERLRAAQDAPYELARRTKAEAERVLWLESRILKQEPVKMRLHSLNTATGLSGDEAGQIGDVIL